MEENIGMRLELLKSGWQLYQLPLQASACTWCVEKWILPNGRISFEYWLISKYSATTICTNFTNFKNILLVFTLISKPLTNRSQWVTNPTTVHRNRGVNIQTVDTSTRIAGFRTTVTVPNPVLKLPYVDAVDYSTMWFWRSEAAQKEKKQQRQRQTTTTGELLKSTRWMNQLMKT